MIRVRLLWRRSLIQKQRILPLCEKGVQSPQTIVAVGGVIIVLFGITWLSASLLSSNRINGIRPFTDYDVNQIAVRIPNLDVEQRANKIDVGGWLFYHKFSMPTEPVNAGQPDRGNFIFGNVFGETREILPNDESAAERNWRQYKRSLPWVNPKFDFEEDTQDKQDECRMQNWAQLYHPTCNNIHEADLVSDYPSGRATYKDTQDLDSFYISHGYFRDVWVLEDKGRQEKRILKIARFEHKIGYTLMRGILNDALIMERLTHSPRIVDVYDHCALSIQVEAIPHEVEEYIVPGSGYIKQKDLHDELDVNPQNDYTATEKLEMALEMAESIADLHGFQDGIIVHDDIQLCQWLRTANGALKLGDFNRAQIMKYNTTSGKYCKYRNALGFGNVSDSQFCRCMNMSVHYLIGISLDGQYRSPEEFANRDLDEKIDVFSFGNNIYGLVSCIFITLKLSLHYQTSILTLSFSIIS